MQIIGGIIGFIGILLFLSGFDNPREKNGGLYLIIGIILFIVGAELLYNF